MDNPPAVMLTFDLIIVKHVIILQLGSMKVMPLLLTDIVLNCIKLILEILLTPSHRIHIVIVFGYNYSVLP